MLEEIRIRDLGVIADTTLPLGPGFTAITGETGAGKTMVVTALGLLMGERSDAGAVRSCAAQARVSGVVHTVDGAVTELVEDLGGDIEEGALVLARTVSSEGRSRANVGGTNAPVGSLAKLAHRLFAVHGQSEQLRLRSSAAQRDTLDRFGGQELADVLAAYRAAHRERRELAAEAEAIIAARDERTAEATRLRAEVEEISAVDPQAGEEDELARRIELLSNVEELRAATSTAHEAIASDSDDPFSQDAATLVGTAERELERVSAHDSRLAEVLETLRQTSMQLGDAARELAAYASDLDERGRVSSRARTNVSPR